MQSGDDNKMIALDLVRITHSSARVIVVANRDAFPVRQSLHVIRELCDGIRPRVEGVITCHIGFCLSHRW